MDGVSDVRYDRRWLDRLVRVVTAARTAGLILAGLLIVASCITVMSVVRLTLFARRQEIEIMQLVGAPLSYIRGPFVLEGTILGTIGALIATFALWGVFAAWKGQLLVSAAPGSSTPATSGSCQPPWWRARPGRRGDRVPRRSLGGARGAVISGLAGQSVV